MPHNSVKRAPSLTKRQPVVVCEDELSPFFNQALNGVLNESSAAVNNNKSSQGRVSPFKEMKMPKFSEILSAHNKSNIASQASLGQPSAADQENQKPDSEPENTFGTPESDPPVQPAKPKVTPASKKSSYHLSISDEIDRQHIENLESKLEDLEI